MKRINRTIEQKIRAQYGKKLPETQIIAGDKALAAMLGVGNLAIAAWREAGHIPVKLVHGRIYIYDLRAVVEAILKQYDDEYQKQMDRLQQQLDIMEKVEKIIEASKQQ